MVSTHFGLTELRSVLSVPSSRQAIHSLLVAIPTVNFEDLILSFQTKKEGGGEVNLSVKNPRKVETDSELQSSAELLSLHLQEHPCALRADQSLGKCFTVTWTPVPAAPSPMAQ